MLEIGSVVLAIAGRDKYRFYVVIRLGQNETEVFIADGNRRKLASPKRKNTAHLRPTKTVLEGDAFRTDKQLRLALRLFNEESRSEHMNKKEGTGHV